MAYKEQDFVKVNFDIYANGKLVQTTNEKKGKEANLEIKDYGPQTIILGKAFILKALDDAILKKDKDSIELTADKAYGKRKKELIKTFSKSSFDEQKIRAVVGMTYDFNGMYGQVKSVIGGRVMVDFNNPLSGKEIKIDYEVENKVEDIVNKLKLVLGSVLRIPSNVYELSVKDKEVTLKAPKQISDMKDMLIKAFIEVVPEFKEYTLKTEEVKLKSK
jgi:FKBP-type peptidyl-prolyl cis-trans isomerase SlyD